jgi:hypothetical protein
MGCALGCARDAVMRLLHMREALDTKAEKRLDRAFEVCGCDKDQSACRGI